MYRLALIASIIFGLGLVRSAGAGEADVVKSITIRAPRDMGYFAGDLVKADIDILVDDTYALEDASLPHAGPIAYWLDLRTIDVVPHRAAGGTRRYTVRILYQNFYDALDARPQEIPTFPITFSNGTTKVSANVPPWTIGVSSLREIAPPVKTDPKDYLRADEPAPYMRVGSLWWGTAAAVGAALLALVVLAYDRAWGPFGTRPARVFSGAVRTLRALAARPDSDSAYLEALLILHRGIDRTAGRRVLADDLPVFLDRHPLFAQLRDSFASFFAASRQAFFGSDPSRAKTDFGFVSLRAFARQLAAIERGAS